MCLKAKIHITWSSAHWITCDVAPLSQKLGTTTLTAIPNCLDKSNEKTKVNKKEWKNYKLLKRKQDMEVKDIKKEGKKACVDIRW